MARRRSFRRGSRRGRVSTRRTTRTRSRFSARRVRRSSPRRTRFGVARRGGPRGGGHRTVRIVFESAHSSLGRVAPGLTAGGHLQAPAAILRSRF